MDQHERERGRTSRASSTSSLGREVRCACQYFQSDSLLPERRAMTYPRPSSRNTQATSRDAAPADQRREHEYEPIGTPLVNPRTMTPVPTAPVVRIIDTDVMPVADSDDSIDLRGRFTPGPTLEGTEIILPLDGQIEDSTMETRELAGGGDTSEELESPQQLQDRLEERFFNAATPFPESTTHREVNASQVDSSAKGELPSRRGARGLPERLRSQAGKLRSRIKSIQRPTFSLSIDRLRSEKAKSPSGKSRGSSERGGKSSQSDKRSTTSERAKNSSAESKPARTTDKRTRMDRIRSSLPDRPRISLPHRPKFNFPDRSKFRMPERPKFNIKKPNVRLPTLGKSRRAPSLGEVQRQRSDESSAGSRRNVFSFSTYPRLFDRKSKNPREYATSSPKESRSDSLESSTLPRAKKTAPLGRGWSQKFTDIKFADDEDDDLGSKTLMERSKPWRRPSLEEPRLSLRAQESIDEPESLPWEDSVERGRSRQIEELPYEDEDEDEGIDREEEELHRGLKLPRGASEESYEDELPVIDPRLYGAPDVGQDARELEVEETDDTEDSTKDREAYRATFMPVDPRYYKRARASEKEPEVEELEGEDDEPLSSGMEEDASGRSDREQQQSSGSSCDRRRRGVVEEIDSDEFFIREKDMGQDDTNIGGYLIKEIRDALRTPENALAREIVTMTSAPTPPQRPVRRRSTRRRKETSAESYEVVAPARSKRDNQRVSVEADDDDVEEEAYLDNADTGISESRHRVVYHAESAPVDLGLTEPLDDIVVVKPMRRRSKTSLRSQSLRRSESLAPQPEEAPEESGVKPSAPPRRRKRLRGEESTVKVKPPPRVNGIPSCNGHHSPLLVEERTRTPAPKKPQRAASRETLKSLPSMKYDREYVEPPPSVPPRRSSRSRGASVAPDDDGTSHGAESIPEIEYTEDDMPRDEDDSRIQDYPGYAMIEKRDKPPRPPPPRKRKDEKFATTPRSGKIPTRPQRAYSTLKVTRSRTPSEVTTPAPRDDVDVTAYEELESDGENERRLRSGVIVNKIQGRPLPAPPRPPRSRRERHDDDEVEVGDEIRETTPGMSEAFASTQTDPLPDDMVIEEEVTQAKLIVSPSRSGSQVLVSMERIPSPTMMTLSMSGTRSFSQGPSDMGRLPVSSGMQYATSADFTSEPPERTASETFGRLRRTPSPVRRATAPIVPPLPAHKSFFRDEHSGDFGCPERDKSPSLRRDIKSKDDDYQAEMETRLQTSLSERIRLEDELERVRSLRSAILTNESLKIASLEVTDLRVENLNVTTLEAQKLTASEIDALVVNATEMSNKSETSERDVNLQPTLLRELMAIRSQLELVHASQEASTESAVDLVKRERRKDGEGHREITLSSQQPVHLQLDRVSRSMETRAIFSSIGSSRESSPQPVTTSARAEMIEAPKKPEPAMKDESAKEETRSSSRSRSSSPGRAGSPTRLRQTASPVKSLPPAISVTPDTPDSTQDRVVTSEGTTPQRAILSYVREEQSPNESLRERYRCPSPPSIPPPSFQPSLISGDSRFIAFQASQIPPEFFSLASPPTTTTRNVEQEPGMVDLGQQLARAVSVACKRAMRHFVGYIVTRIGQEETDTKMREIELVLCALLLIIAGLLIVCFGGPRTITHHHHWDYFNPPRM